MTNSEARGRVHPALRLLLPVAVLAAGAIAAWYLLATRPQATRKPAPRLARLVDVEPARRTTRPIVVEAMGTVVPARRVDLVSQVGGVLVEVAPDFEPGGRFAAGETLAVVDPRDFELAERQRAAELADAEAQLALEMGNQEVARREADLLGDVVREGQVDLVLRKPQLDAARARVAAARAALDVARLALERTRIRAPFAGIVETRQAVLGTRVDASTVLATLVATDEFWIEVTLPARALRWLPDGSADAPGVPARVFDRAAWEPGAVRQGTVVRRLVDVEAEGRLARLLVAVPDPLGTSGAEQAAPALLLGSFVHVELVGPEIAGIVLDRAAIRGGDEVWLMGSDSALEVRAVEIGYRGREHVVVTDGLADGERVVVSELSAPVPGMPLRLAEDERDG